MALSEAHCIAEKIRFFFAQYCLYRLGMGRELIIVLPLSYAQAQRDARSSYPCPV